MLDVWESAIEAVTIACTDATVEALGNDASEVELAFYAAVVSEAVIRLFRTPAPDLGALAMKMELFISELGHKHADPTELMKAMFADVGRFSG